MWGMDGRESVRTVCYKSHHYFVLMYVTLPQEQRNVITITDTLKLPVWS